MTEDDWTNVGFDSGPDPIVLTSESNHESISEMVVRGTSRMTGRSVGQLPSLAGSIDPDALESLFDPVPVDGETTVNGMVIFEYADCQVVIRSDERVAIEPLEKPGSI